MAQRNSHNRLATVGVQGRQRLLLSLKKNSSFQGRRTVQSQLHPLLFTCSTTAAVPAPAGMMTGPQAAAATSPPPPPPRPAVGALLPPLTHAELSCTPQVGVTVAAWTTPARACMQGGRQAALRRPRLRACQTPFCIQTCRPTRGPQLRWPPILGRTRKPCEAYILLLLQAML